MADKQIVVKFIGDTKSFDDATKKAIGGAEKIGVSFKDLSIGGFAAGLGAKAAAGALGLVSSAADAAIDYITGSVKASSNLRESMALAEQVFEDNTEAVTTWGDTTSDTLGTSKRDALDMASGFGNAFKNVGMSLDETTDKSIELATRAVDLGSAFNTSSEEAATALRSGLLGESEPLRKFGVFIDEAKTKAKMLAMGMKPVNGVFTDAQKVTARYNIILEQTSDSAGMFGRDANSLADAQKSVNAQMEDAQAKLGDKLLPVLVKLANFTSDVLVPALSAAVDGLDALGTAANMVAGPFGSMGKTGDAVTLTIQNNTNAAMVGTAAWGTYATSTQAAADAASGADKDQEALRKTTENLSLVSFRAGERASELADATVTVGDAAEEITPSIKELTRIVLEDASGFDTLRDAVRSAADEMIDDKYAPQELALELSIATGEAKNARTALKDLLNPDGTPKKGVTWQQVNEAKLEIIDADKKVEKLTVDVRTLDSTSVARITAYISSLGGKINWAGDEALRWLRLLKDIDNAASNMNYRPGGGGSIGGRAKGGPAAGLTWVGEEGPELLNLPAGSYVHSNPESMRMVTTPIISGRGGGGGGVTVVVQGNIVGVSGVEELSSMIAMQMRLAGA